MCIYIYIYNYLYLTDIYIYIYVYVDVRPFVDETSKLSVTFVQLLCVSASLVAALAYFLATREMLYPIIT